MPVYDYRCVHGHTVTHLRSIADGYLPAICPEGHPAARVEIAPTHSPPDGVYSYAPNIGDPDRFERQRAAIKSGTKVIPRTADLPREARDGQLTSRKRARGF